MLRITVTLEESFNDETQEFVTTDSIDLQLEHSLVSLSKWESKWEKPFLGGVEKTSEEVLDYVRCMVLNDVDPDVFKSLSQENVDDIVAYIESSQTATIVNDGTSNKKTRNKEIVTSELVYYWMVSHGIPFECQYWHFNKLMTLIRVLNIKNQPEKKRSKREILEENKALNAERRAKYNTKG